MYTVYVHINKANGKKYVGITSTSVKRRWRNGFGYSRKLPIGRAIEKYGWQNFEHIILYENLTEDDAKAKEIELIKLWKTQENKYGYNICAGGNGVTGWCPTDETKQKISNAAKQRRGKRNPNFGHRWTKEMRKKSAIAHRRENLSTETIRRMSEAASKRVGNNNPFFGRHHTEHTREILGQLRARPVSQYSKDGEFIKRYKSIKDAAQATLGNKVGISNCCRGKTQTSGGYKWIYVD